MSPLISSSRSKRERVSSPSPALQNNMSEMESFLATIELFRELGPEQLREIAPLCQVEHFAAGAIILNQGAPSEALYFLRSGRLAVRVRKEDHRETVALLQPPAVFGELSFIT